MRGAAPGPMPSWQQPGISASDFRASRGLTSPGDTRKANMKLSSWPGRRRGEGPARSGSPGMSASSWPLPHTRAPAQRGLAPGSEPSGGRPPRATLA